METKKCTGCNKDKDIKFFGKNKSKKDGLQTYCKACCKRCNSNLYRNSPKRRESIYRRNKLAKDKIREYLRSYLFEKKCSICGFDNILALEFHHRDRETKVFSIGMSTSKKVSIDTLQKELDKCDILCANCHRILEAEFNNSYKLGD